MRRLFSTVVVQRHNKLQTDSAESLRHAKYEWLSTTGMKLEVVDEKCEMKKWKCCLNEPFDHQDQICWQIDNGMKFSGC